LPVISSGELLAVPGVIVGAGNSSGEGFAVGGTGVDIGVGAVVGGTDVDVGAVAHPLNKTIIKMRTHKNNLFIQRFSFRFIIDVESTGLTYPLRGKAETYVGWGRILVIIAVL